MEAAEPFFAGIDAENEFRASVSTDWERLVSQNTDVEEPAPVTALKRAWLSKRDAIADLIRSMREAEVQAEFSRKHLERHKSDLAAITAALEMLVATKN